VGAASYDRFGPYTIHECLGAGGMAIVHRASLDIGSGVIREVALKRLLPQFADDRAFVGDFVREAKIAAQLRHPNIVRILELGKHEHSGLVLIELPQQLMQDSRGLCATDLFHRIFASVDQELRVVDHRRGGVPRSFAAPTAPVVVDDV